MKPVVDEDIEEELLMMQALKKESKQFNEDFWETFDKEKAQWRGQSLQGLYDDIYRRLKGD